MKKLMYISNLISKGWLAISVFFFPTYHLEAEDSTSKEYVVINNPCYNPGMFCVLNTVMGFLYFYDQGRYAGLRVDFANQGLYYDPRYGSNWWQYYFEPIELGKATDQATIKSYGGTDCILYDMFTQKDLTPLQVYELTQKYIRLRPHIQKKLNQFVDDYFGDYFIIGIHYRGTDKFQEAPRVAYEKVLEAIIDQINQLQLNHFKIFVATDEREFLSYIHSYFPQQILYQDIFRSSTRAPIHLNSENPCQIGEDALLDCLLLSRSQLLIRTASRLSLWSSYFNPDLPTISLNQAYY